MSDECPKCGMIHAPSLGKNHPLYKNSIKLVNPAQLEARIAKLTEALDVAETTLRKAIPAWEALILRMDMSLFKSVDEYGVGRVDVNLFKECREALAEIRRLRGGE